MQYYLLNIKTVGILVSCLVCISCASLNLGSDLEDTGSSYKPTKIETKEPIRFQVRGTPDESEVSVYHSHSKTKRFEDYQLRHEKEEIVDFKIKTTTKDYEPKTGATVFWIEALEKDGFVNLHDLAFPEVGETLIYSLSKDAEVIVAGNYPRDSIFYVPPLSLPKKPVKIGDTWTMNHVWKSGQNGIILSLELLTIFKNLYQCGPKELCADFEISGEVIIPQVQASPQELRSTLSGRILISVNSGAILWSDIRNEERIVVANTLVEVYSCLEGQRVSPKAKAWPWKNRKSCDPMVRMPEPPPGI